MLLSKHYARATPTASSCQTTMSFEHEYLSTYLRASVMSFSKKLVNKVKNTKYDKKRTTRVLVNFIQSSEKDKIKVF